MLFMVATDGAPFSGGLDKEVVLEVVDDACEVVAGQPGNL